jgi:hypothetical protein
MRVVVTQDDIERIRRGADVFGVLAHAVSASTGCIARSTSKEFIVKQGSYEYSFGLPEIVKQFVDSSLLGHAVFPMEFDLL